MGYETRKLKGKNYKPKQVKIQMKKNDYGEYEVRWVDGGKVIKSKTYFTDDKEDAKNTMKLIQIDADRINAKRSGQKSKKYTLAEIKEANLKAGHHFFDKGTMKFFKETMSDYKVEHEGQKIYVVRKKDGRRSEFDHKTGFIRPS